MADKTVEEMLDYIVNRNRGNMAMIPWLLGATPAEIRAKYAEMNGGETDD